MNSSPGRCNVQAYVTCDTSDLSSRDCEDLTNKLYDEIIPISCAHPARLDVTFIGSIDSNSNSTSKGASGSIADDQHQQQWNQ